MVFELWVGKKTAAGSQSWFLTVYFIAVHVMES